MKLTVVLYAHDIPICNSYIIKYAHTRMICDNIILLSVCAFTRPAYNFTIHGERFGNWYYYVRCRLYILVYYLSIFILLLLLSLLLSCIHCAYIILYIIVSVKFRFALDPYSFDVFTLRSALVAKVSTLRTLRFTSIQYEVRYT